MVAPIGVGKAAAAVAEGAEKLGSKGADKATHAASEQFEQLLEDPSHAGASGNAGQAAGATNNAGQVAGVTAAGPNAAGSAMSPTQVSALQTKAADVVGPGDKILRGIDQVRGEADQLVQQVGAITGAGGAGKVSDILSMQASLASFEVTTQVGGKAMQEGNQAVQTLLKGQ